MKVSIASLAALLFMTSGDAIDSVSAATSSNNNNNNRRSLSTRIALPIEDPAPLFENDWSIGNKIEDVTPEPTSARTSSPTSSAKSADGVVTSCPPGQYTMAFRSLDCTGVALCENGILTKKMKCNTAIGEIYDTTCSPKESILDCCSNSAEVTCPTSTATRTPDADTGRPTTLGPTSSPTNSPTSKPTKSPTKTPTKAPTKKPTQPEPAGYEMARTSNADPWVWTRDYSNCNRRNLAQETSGIVDDKIKRGQGVRGASHHRALKADDKVADTIQDVIDQKLTPRSAEIQTSKRNEDGDDIAVLAEDEDDIQADGITGRSDGVPTSFRDDNYIERDKKEKNNKNKNNDRNNNGRASTCTPERLAEGRQSVLSTQHTCPSSSSPFGSRHEVAEVSGYTVPECSGIVASRINPGIIWAHNDYDNHHNLFAVDQTTGSVRTYEINGGYLFDYEDIARGSGPIAGADYLYVGDIGDNYSRRRSNWNPTTIYRIREPNLKTLNDNKLRDRDKLKLSFTDGPHNCEAMMFDPISERIIIITKSSGSIWITPRKWGDGDDAMTLQNVGRIKTMKDDVTGVDISADGTEFIVKFYDAIYYFCLGSRDLDNPDDAWKEVVDVLSDETGIQVPYSEEPQGEAVCFSHEFDGGIYTLSEARRRSKVPLYHYARL